MAWNYLPILKLQRCNRWSLGMDKLFHPTLYWACDYLSMLGLKLNRVCKSGPWQQAITRTNVGQCPWRHMPPIATQRRLQLINGKYCLVNSRTGYTDKTHRYILHILQSAFHQTSSVILTKNVIRTDKAVSEKKTQLVSVVAWITVLEQTCSPWFEVIWQGLEGGGRLNW